VRDAQFPLWVANGCRSCGYDFSSVEGYDAHWRLWPGHRRDELLPFDEDDLRAAGFAQTAHSRWGIASRIEQTRSRVLRGTLKARGAS
jgi:hypothetical protein